MGQKKRELRRKSREKREPTTIEDKINEHSFTKLGEQVGKGGILIGITAMIYFFFKLALRLGLIG